ncbi:MAG: hypothetical protein KDA84_09840 [Planctomycetaceae bacterium]|nr:hypothetical protein [Planctomycetaceae bacterium]
MRFSATHRWFFWFDQGLVPGIVNFFIVGLLAWVTFRTASTVPMWGSSSVVSEILATGFLLPLITCLINGRIILWKVRRGQLAPLPRKQFPRGTWHQYRSSTRGVLFGLVGLVFAVGMIPLVLYRWPGTEMDSTTFIIAKSIWAGVFGLIVTPLIGWMALANATLKLSQNQTESPQGGAKANSVGGVR